MWINIPDELMSAIVMLLKEQKNAMGDELEKLKEQFTDTSPLAEAYREAAGGADGELEVDDNAVVSYSEGDAAGAYVMAWQFVYLSDTSLGLPAECPACGGDEFDCYGKCQSADCKWELDTSPDKPHEDTGKFVVYNPSELGWWNNDTGWGEYGSADKFTAEERDKLRLPTGGIWTPARVLAKMQPQVWLNNYAEDEGEAYTFDVTDAVLAMGSAASLCIRDSSTLADDLWHKHAIKFVRPHDGPFCLTVADNIKAFWGRE